jgi:putative ABC transport system permease protein
MQPINKFMLRLRSILRRPKVEAELDYEISFHLQQQIEENIAAGMNPEAARHAALRTFGASSQIKEECRDERRVSYVEHFFQDLRYGLRQLRGNPGFTAVALVTLALGIGANTTIFSITNQVLLRRLPVDHPEELVILRSPGHKSGNISADGDGAASFSYPMFKALREQGSQAAELFASFGVGLSVVGQGQTEHTAGDLVSGNYFQVLGVRPAMGRLFTIDDETAPGANPVAVLSYGYWQRRFGMDPSILNKTLIVNGVSLTVVGVARSGFTGVQVGHLPDVFIPLTMKAQMTPNWDGLANPSDYWLPILARVKPGFTPARAEVALLPTYRAILESQAQQMKMSPASIPKFAEKPILLDPGSRGRQILQENVKQPLTILMAMVVLVLLIGCANLASLQLARGAARHREMAVRLALGAGRRRLIRQLLTESFLLAMLGGGLGLVAGLATLKALIGWIPRSYGAVGLEARPDSSILGFALGVSAVTGILFGLAPALRATRAGLQSTLKEQGSTVSGGVSNIRLRKTLIVSQIAVTAILLIGASLFARSLNSLNKVDLGLKTDHLMVFSISPELNRYSPAQTAALATGLSQAIMALPGVRSVSASETPVLAGDDQSSNITLEGYTPQEEEDMHVETNYVGSNFFSTMGSPLLAGREITEADGASSPKVAVVNESFARRFLDGRSPVGIHFAFGAGSKVHPNIEIVGMVKDSRNIDVRGDVSMFAYLPYTQRDTLGAITFYTRTDHDPASMAGLLREAVAKIDANLPVYNLKTMADQVNEVLFNDRLLTVLSLSFALLAALLAAVGLYGVMAYSVAQRTREVGIRVALGASRTNVIWLVLRDVVVMAAAGLAAGSFGAFAASRFVESELFGVKAKDPVAFALAILLLTAVALLAGYLPARRAASVDPMKALRYE